MDTSQTFHQLKTILTPYEGQLTLQHDTSDNYYLNTPITESNKKADFFGAVQIKKSYVAFHLMPVYYFPDLLDNISPDLKKKMQGKSCFHFKEADDQCMEELSALTKKSFEKYKSLNKV